MRARRSIAGQHRQRGGLPLQIIVVELARAFREEIAAA
jgi:hypothetical protein